MVDDDVLSFDYIGAKVWGRHDTPNIKYTRGIKDAGIGIVRWGVVLPEKLELSRRWCVIISYQQTYEGCDFRWDDVWFHVRSIIRHNVMLSTWRENDTIRVVLEIREWQRCHLVSLQTLIICDMVFVSMVDRYHCHWGILYQNIMLTRILRLLSLTAVTRVTRIFQNHTESDDSFEPRERMGM